MATDSGIRIESHSHTDFTMGAPLGHSVVATKLNGRLFFVIHQYGITTTTPVREYNLDTRTHRAEVTEKEACSLTIYPEGCSIGHRCDETDSTLLSPDHTHKLTLSERRVALWKLSSASGLPTFRLEVEYPHAVWVDDEHFTVDNGDGVRLYKISGEIVKEFTRPPKAQSAAQYSKTLGRMIFATEEEVYGLPEDITLPEGKHSLIPIDPKLDTVAILTQTESGKLITVIDHRSTPPSHYTWEVDADTFDKSALYPLKSGRWVLFTQSTVCTDCIERVEATAHLYMPGTRSKIATYPLAPGPKGSQYTFEQADENTCAAYTASNRHNGEWNLHLISG